TVVQTCALPISYFEKIFHYEAITKLPVKAIGLDFVHGESLDLLKTYGFPKDKVLAAGIIDGRNVWRADLEEKLTTLETIKQFVQEDQIGRASCRERVKKTE